jgi:hypothetical protein
MPPSFAIFEDDKPFAVPPNFLVAVSSARKGQPADTRCDKENEDPLGDRNASAGLTSSRSDAKTPARNRKSHGGSAPPSKRTPLADITPLKDEDAGFNNNAPKATDDENGAGGEKKKMRKKLKKAAASNATSKGNGGFGLQHRPPTHLNSMFAASVR